MMIMLVAMISELIESLRWAFSGVQLQLDRPFVDLPYRVRSFRGVLSIATSCVDTCPSIVALLYSTAETGDVLQSGYSPRGLAAVNFYNR
eukprot:1836612-Amphidinium_carterae.1